MLQFIIITPFLDKRQLGLEPFGNIQGGSGCSWLCRQELYEATHTVRRQLLDEFHKTGAKSVFLLGMPLLNRLLQPDCYTCAQAHYAADIEAILKVMRQLGEEDGHL